MNKAGRPASKAKKATTEVATPKSSGKAVAKPQTLTLVSTLNFHPKNADSLKDFYGRYSAKTNYEKNLVFVYYLQNVLKSDEIGLNHIYSCYKHVGERVPGDLYQSIRDTKKNQGWLDISNMNKISVPVAGENYFEHDLKQK